MKELLKKTGLNFSSGSRLTSNDINTMNDRINDLIELNNHLLKSIANVNHELDTGEIFTLEQAIEKIPESRRKEGIKVIFRGERGWEEHIWQGTEWSNTKYWDSNLTGGDYDAGEW